jgi:hypothetical protein
MIKRLAILVFLLPGCPQSKKADDDGARSQEIVLAKPNPEYSITVKFEQGPTEIAVSLEELPAHYEEAICEIGALKIPHCENGFTIKDQKSGKYLMQVTVKANLPSPLKYEVDFEIVDGKLPSQAVIKYAYIVKAIDLITDEQFDQHGAMPFNVEAKIKIKVDNYTGCRSKLLCSRIDGVWALCNQTKAGEILIPSHEMIQGFQKLLVKAVCENDQARGSNMLEFYWYGVGPSYQPLSLTSRKVGDYVHYRLERAADCASGLEFECRDSADGELSSCMNVKLKPSPSFQIRAVCLSSREKRVGPLYVAPASNP